ncbi:MAG: arginine--tRNA ligase [Ignavibacteria bacterium GWA2_54_16]|nr:MAG: arginine--tRNA ligase [Ignavibacteria bacterium GWA2_54_16]
MKRYLSEKISAALASLNYLQSAKLTFEKPRVEAHGDLTTNVAMLLAKSLGKNPRVIAQEIVSALTIEPESISKVEIAGPGFINVRFTEGFFNRQVAVILGQGDTFGRSDVGAKKKTQVEFVSANPTGPLSVGHGRQAAIGDTLANLLEWTNHDVTREYYYNNAGRQMRMLAESTYARYRQLFDSVYAFPDDGYQGEYIREIAEKLKEAKGDSLCRLENEQAIEQSKAYAEAALFEAIKKVLGRMGVHFDVFFNEDSLYKDGLINEVVAEFRRQGLAYDKDGAVWLKATALGLDQDRVIVKSTGEPTYRLPDIAYHREKFRRGFELVVDVFGADHIATIPDVLAGVRALGYDPEKVKVVIHQFVTLMRDGQQVKMSKRSANFVTLDELIDEVGSDAVRFFFLMRGVSTHLEFDLNLALEQSEKNPVYYVQYAHARIASILRFAETEGLLTLEVRSGAGVKLEVLVQLEEIALVKLLLEFPEIVESACFGFEPQRLTTYLHDVATSFHKFYHEHRVVIPERDISQARLALCQATKTVLSNGCKILGISAPERM